MIEDGEFVRAVVAQLPALRRYAVALAGNAAQADDLVQDSIERALRQASQLRELKSLPGWLRRILYNRYIDGIRRDRFRGKVQDIFDHTDDPALSVPAIDGAEARDFLRAINALSAEHRQILLLVGIEDLSYQEISDELGIPLGTVMSRLARARERLRVMIQNGPGADVRPSAAKEER